LVAVDLNRAIFSIDLQAGRILDRWGGRWLDAAVAPDGHLVVALDLAGGLHSRPGPRTAPSSRGWSKRGSSQRRATSSPQRIPVRDATSTSALYLGSIASTSRSSCSRSSQTSRRGTGWLRVAAVRPAPLFRTRGERAR
jgi:hypothetical protein